ncbi:MAG: rod shape-determining protein MreC [candidate division Zixibacteria bacterium]|nr:rod shape-determining protein MreC [candidate division Zixibacteria bacterium]
MNDTQLGSLKKNELIITASLIFLCLLLILVPGGIKQSIAGIGISVFYLPINTIQNKFKDLYNIRERARELETELAESKLKLSYYVDAVDENKRLREFLEFSASYDAYLIPAEIVKRPEKPHRMSVLINVGKKEGAELDMAVITPEGLAGRITRVYDDGSEVQLLTDPSSRASAVDVRNRVHGIIKPKATGGLMMDNIPVHQLVAVNDTIKSSGLGGVFPAGIPIGTISNVTVPSPASLFLEVSIDPFADFNRIERLFLVARSE